MQELKKQHGLKGSDRLHLLQGVVIVADLGVPVLAPFTRSRGTVALAVIVVVVVVVVVRLPPPGLVLLGAPQPHGTSLLPS